MIRCFIAIMNFLDGGVLCILGGQWPCGNGEGGDLGGCPRLNKAAVKFASAGAHSSSQWVAVVR